MLLQYFIRALIRVNFFTISQAACSSSTRDMQLVVAVTTLIRLKWPNHNRMRFPLHSRPNWPVVLAEVRFSPKATDLPHCREMTRRAIFGLMRRSNVTLLDHLIGARKKGWR